MSRMTFMSCTQTSVSNSMTENSGTLLNKSLNPVHFLPHLCPVSCVSATVVEEFNPTVDFLGLNVNEASATAGQWVLLVLGIALLVSTAFLAYKYRKSRRLHNKSISQMELK